MFVCLYVCRSGVLCLPRNRIKTSKWKAAISRMDGGNNNGKIAHHTPTRPLYGIYWDDSLCCGSVWLFFLWRCCKYYYMWLTPVPLICNHKLNRIKCPVSVPQPRAPLYLLRRKPLIIQFQCVCACVYLMRPVVEPVSQSRLVWYIVTNRKAILIEKFAKLFWQRFLDPKWLSICIRALEWLKNARSFGQVRRHR